MSKTYRQPTISYFGKHVYRMKNKNKCGVSLDFQFSNFLFLKLDFIKIVNKKRNALKNIVQKRRKN